jgi:hypothetical protein
VKRVAELLGEDWVFVSTEEIAALEKEYLQREKLTFSVPGELILTGRGRASLSLSVRNASEEPVEAAFELDGADSDPVKALIGPGKKETVEIGFVPREDRAVLRASFDGKTKEYGLLIRAFDLTELPADLRGRRFEQAAHYGAASLPSINSETYTTGEGVGYKMAVHGESRDGAVIYGPYKPLEPGCYVAVFSLVRLDDKGDGGEVCLADVVPAGSEEKACGVSVDRGMLPVGKQAFVYAPFEWKEAADFEARIHWKKSSDSLRVDGVTLLRAVE